MPSVSSFPVAVIQLLKCTHAREEVKLLQNEKKKKKEGLNLAGIKQGYNCSATGLAHSAGQCIGHLPVSFVHL